MSRNDSESSDNESLDDFEEEPGPPVTCLFCDHTSDTITASIEHVKTSHDFNIEAFLSKNVSSTYDLIKIVTFVRRGGVTPCQLEASSRGSWASEDYLKPVDPSDPWLWTDFEFLDCNDDDDLEPKYVNSENGVITLSKEHFDQLQKKNQELEKLLEEKDRQMDRLRNLLNEAERPREGGPSRPGDDAYFTSYACFQIHREMLSDAPRMEAFSALFRETELFRGKSVLDVGCGTGILSMMAASAGATSVVGVDDSEIVYTGLEIVAENGLESAVRLVKGRVEALQLEERFDVIVSEWMGYFLLFEGMLSSVIDARDRFLKPEGLVFPRTFSLYLVGLSNPVAREARLRSEFCGFKMRAFGTSGLTEPTIECATSEQLCTEPALVYRIDALTATKEECYFSSDFVLVGSRQCELTAICGYFDSGFEPTKATLTTSPLAPPTHWKQTIFYLERTIALREGERLEGRVSVSPGAGDGSRGIQVQLTIASNSQTYIME